MSPATAPAGDGSGGLPPLTRRLAGGAPMAAQHHRQHSPLRPFLPHQSHNTQDSTSKPEDKGFTRCGKAVYEEYDIDEGYGLPRGPRGGGQFDRAASLCECGKCLQCVLQLSQAQEVDERGSTREGGSRCSTSGRGGSEANWEVTRHSRRFSEGVSRPQRADLDYVGVDESEDEGKALPGMLRRRECFRCLRTETRQSVGITAEEVEEILSTTGWNGGLGYGASPVLGQRAALESRGAQGEAGEGRSPPRLVGEVAAYRSSASSRTKRAVAQDIARMLARINIRKVPARWTRNTINFLATPRRPSGSEDPDEMDVLVNEAKQQRLWEMEQFLERERPKAKQWREQKEQERVATLEEERKRAEEQARISRIMSSYLTHVAPERLHEAAYARRKLMKRAEEVRKERRLKGMMW